MKRHTANQRARRCKVAALALAGTLLSACGLETSYGVPYEVNPGLIKADPSLRGVELTIGSKEFTENVLLGYMTQYALSAAGAEVSDLTNIQGSFSTRQALTSEQTDVYWDYTGTGWLSYLGQDKPIPDQKQQYDAVRAQDLREYGVTWLPYAKLNNTYAFAVSDSFAQQNGIETISDMAELVKKDPAKAKVCAHGEFSDRPDGLPGVQQRYGFEVSDSNKVALSLGTIPNAIGGACQFGVVNSTDGRILARKLRVLQDDKEFFPKYNASAVLRSETLRRYPGIAKAIAPLTARLDNQTLLRLNQEVDVTGRSSPDVAKDWMVSQGLVSEPDTP